MSATPLAGLKVLEFSHTVMGPTAGLVFAELGADVVKVEPAPQGDHTRGLGGFAAGFFAAFNRNKRSLALDLKRPEGQAAMHRLAATADVVIENYGPGTMERLGCGYETLATVNPRLVYLALKGYLAGPYEHRPALDEVVQFQVGLAYMTGPPGQPLRAGASIIDILGAVFGVVAVQAALRERETTGKGQRVSSALFESAAFLMSTHMAGMAATGLPARADAGAARRLGDLRGVPDGRMGQLFIGVTSDQQWTPLRRGVRLAGARRRSAPRHQPDALPGARLADPGAQGGAGASCRKPRWRGAASAPTSPGRRSASRATCSPTRICWRRGGLLDVFISRAGGTEGRKVAPAGVADRVRGAARAPGPAPPAAAPGRAQRRRSCGGRVVARRDCGIGRGTRDRRGRLIGPDPRIAGACYVLRRWTPPWNASGPSHRGEPMRSKFALFQTARSAARRAAGAADRVRRDLVRIALRRSGAAAHLRHLRRQRRQPLPSLRRALQGDLQAQRRRPRGARVRRIVRQPQGARGPGLRRACGLRPGRPRLQQGRARPAVRRTHRLRAAVGLLYRRANGSSA